MYTLESTPLILFYYIVIYILYLLYSEQDYYSASAQPRFILEEESI